MEHIPPQPGFQLERRTWFWAAALMCLAMCCVLAFPFWPNRLQLLDMGKLVGYGWLSFLPWISGVLLWVTALIAMCWQLRGSAWPQTRLLIVTTTTVVYLMFVAMYPTSAIDVYIYAARSRLFSHYGQNPNAVEPIVYWDVDPYMRFASKEWADNLSPYGPLWNTLAYPVTAIGGDSIGAAIVGFKLISVISILIMSWLIYNIVRLRNEEWAIPAAIFLLWNPLVMWDGIGNAHNDITLMLPVIAALWCWARRHDQWIVPLLVASVLIKYVTIILLPIAVVALWRRNPQWHIRIAASLWGLAWSLILVTIALYPFYDLGAIARSAEAQGNRVSLSPAWVAQATMAERGWTPPDNETVRIVAYALMCIYIAGWMIACWRQPSRLPRALFEVTFAFMWIASTNQRHWYVLWLVPLGAALIPGTPWRRTLLWSVTAIFGHGCTIWLWYVYDIPLRGYYWYAMLIVAIVYGPVLLLTLWELGNHIITRTSRKPVTPTLVAT